MVHGRVVEAALAMGGELISDQVDAVWQGASLDSRRVSAGELFFALAGERSDGHEFVDSALERGASAAVVREGMPLPTSGAAIVVDDTFEALHRLTRVVRDEVPEQLIAITGSIGKTTTKELLADMLAKRFRVAKNPGNLNNLYGFPIALLGIPDDTEWMVAEMGMSTPGELSRISRLGRPDVAVFTNVRPVHLEFFGSLRKIADAKAELLDGLSEGGTVIANRDDAEVMRIAQSHDGPVVWYAFDVDAEYEVREVEPLGEGRVGTRFVLVASGEEMPIELALHGRYNVENFVAAAACAHSLGVDLDSIRVVARSARSESMRGIVHAMDSGIWLIDDAYNSNPQAALAALKSALDFPGERYWAVLGDMLELGETSSRLHEQVGEEAAALGFSPIVGVGDLARDLVRAAASHGAETRWFSDAVEASVALEGALQPGDVTLIKGSRGVGLERVVEALKGRTGEDA
ncbi:MAG: UDP-N-acetylmuramoyl-tripeptide--D-alanyl-D-alanine ligase [Acidobacteriota bacterium]